MSGITFNSALPSALGDQSAKFRFVTLISLQRAERVQRGLRQNYLQALYAIIAAV
jgi:hypothetical protein